MKLLLKWVLLCVHHLLINGIKLENRSPHSSGQLSCSLSARLDLCNFKPNQPFSEQFIDNLYLPGNSQPMSTVENKIHEFSTPLNPTDRLIQDAVDRMYNADPNTAFADINIRPKRELTQPSSLSPPPQTSSTVDPKVKRKLQVHFSETIEAQYLPFYKWLYKSLNNGTQSVYAKFKDSVMDMNFVPSNGLTSTPFPIPYKLEAVYEYINYEKSGKKPNGTFSYTRPSPETDSFEYGSEELAVVPVPITPMRHEMRDKLQRHFTEATMKPEYETFYKWLYEVLDFGKIPLTDKYDQLVRDKTFSLKTRWPVTPFPVPFKYNAIFEYLWRQEYLRHKKKDESN